MQRVNLYYLSPNRYGGWVTFTIHLMKALRTAGLEPRLFRIRSRTEGTLRNFDYGLQYSNLSVDDALRQEGPHLIVAAAKKFQEETRRLVKAGAFLVLHDPTELKNLPPLTGERTIVIRQAGLKVLPTANFIRHPYSMFLNDDEVRTSPQRTVRAMSTSRIDFDKHTEIILDANRMLGEEIKVRIHGFENRLYTRFKIVPKYPEWKQSIAHYTRSERAAVDLLSNAQLSVDMSVIQGDGGGTQYTTLEAWDAGAVPVIHKDWFSYVDGPDDMRPDENCVVVQDALDLATTIRNRYNLYDLRMNGRTRLKTYHDPERIGQQYKAVLCS